MPLPNTDTVPTSLWERIKKHLNFFRIHLLLFTVIPLITSGVFFACNGEFPIAYIDCLFLCYSAMTVTGLSTLNLSSLTGFQQAILFVLMLAGDQTMVSLIMVLVRKQYFHDKCLEVVRSHPPRPAAQLFRTITKDIGKFISSPITSFPISGKKSTLDERSPAPPLGIISEKPTQNEKGDLILSLEEGESGPSSEHQHAAPFETEGPGQLEAPRNSYDPSGTHSITSSPQNMVTDIPNSPEPVGTSLNEQGISRRRTNVQIETGGDANRSGLDTRNISGPQGFGFPDLSYILRKLLQRIAPRVYRKVHRSLTLPQTRTQLSVYRSRMEVQDSGYASMNREPVKWLNFDKLVVDRNSHFRTDTLSSEQLEMLGGTEYRALRYLSWIVGLYFVGIQLFGFIAMAGWLVNSGTYDSVFQNQFRLVPKAWYGLIPTLFSGIAYIHKLTREWYPSNGFVYHFSIFALSALSDVFNKAYLMIFVLIFVILAGNHGLPLFLRLSIWICTKFVDDRSPADEALHFLLDHPRRCYIFLFPSEVTWFLAFILLLLSSIELFAFCVLDTGLAVTQSLPLGQRVVDGLFQSLAVRASGFSIVNLSALAPSVQFLYVVMMYIAVFPVRGPVAMSIRSTNVYEEKSLGIFVPEPEDEEDVEPDIRRIESRRERIFKYLGWHVRHQLSFDLWWLVVGIWLVAIIERDKIMDEDNFSWFNIFRIIFELVSAYGTIGLTLGIPTENYSFSGACRTLSKLVIIAVMLRGRHRGLPVAVDRAIELPEEFKRQANEPGKGVLMEKPSRQPNP
ncbi:TrkH-domain-containing protein [Sistotremastrum suecicum HHB10207 ss-3]|uniref:TrkH-domain-containing protein n=1 Tax=Sistotremastrum suecicum HHB10207 ss-3 TaxID=1314776 RepID=A0A166D931_9AGAM|nr:TrkH-domain-containing protein [Sistotremastrum suecicum HHB10207 ss-3]